MTGDLNIDTAFFLKYLFDPPAIVWKGLWLTIWISVVAQAAGVAVGLMIALCIRSTHAWLRGFGKFYVWVWRGTPLLVQLVVIYTGVAAAGFYRYPDIQLGPFTLTGPLQAALITLSLNEAAYMAEIFRAALSSIDKGQFDAARALGMRPFTAMRWIILPQAARMVIPPLGNEFTLMIKGTSLLAILGIRELFGTIQQLNAATFRTFELFIIAAIWYLILTTIMGFVQKRLEAHYGRYDQPNGGGKAASGLRSLFSGQR
ncbi:MAG: amino acid ABC transporter permease [Parvibaculaceae bacterium]